MTALEIGLIEDAERRLAGVVNRTPVVRSRTFDQECGAQVLVKAENFQRTGSFKFRGAYNTLAALPEATRTRGVCTVSSGNHAQALALAARLLGVPAVVLMPEDAPPLKLAAVRGYGAEVVTYDRSSMPQWQAGEHLQQERGLPFVSSHDDPLISAGAGTAVLELLEEVGDLDVLLAPVGGGGGMAGYSSAMRARQPHARVVAVEPTVSGLLEATLAAGRRVDRPVPATIADGLMLTRIGAVPFEVMKETVDEVVQVTEAEITRAMRFLFERMKLVVEPSGAVAFAALLAGGLDVTRQKVGVVLSGGNVTPATLARLIG